MRFLYPLLMFCALGIVLAVFVNENLSADPSKTGETFLKAVHEGQYQVAVDQFGGNACKCPAKGGWVSYLIYSSSQEPNLAFMTGKSFNYSMGKPLAIETSEEAKKGSVPWQAPEDVVIDVKIDFNKNDFMPLFLPVNMAYGKDMSEEELLEFLKDPDSEAWKGFTLRFRPSLEKGAIDRPDASRGIKYNPTEKLQTASKSKSGSSTTATRSTTSSPPANSESGTANTPGKSTSDSTPTGDSTATSHSTATGDSTDTSTGRNAQQTEDNENYVYAPVEDMIRETLGEEGVLYLHPRDPGKVIRADQSTYEIGELEKILPRLQTANLRLHIVRRGQLKNWTVYHFALTDPVLLLSDGKTKTLNNYRPKYDNDKWNPRTPSQVHQR